MNAASDSPQYQKFAALLSRIVTVPRSEIKGRMDDDAATKDWVEKNGLPKKRNRPIVSPAAVASSRNQP